MSDAAVRVHGLTKRYGAGTAVERLSLAIPRGCTFGLLGVNGAGKSTTLKMLMGLLPIDEGSAHVLGVDVAADPVELKQRVGYVPELPCIHPWMEVGEVLRFCRPLYRRWNDGLAREMLDLLALDEGKRVAHLSKGMARKLHLLLAIVHEPDVLLLDEPLSGLDPLVREEFTRGILTGIQGRRATVVLSSHQIGDVQRLADRVGILHEGRLLHESSVEELVGGTRRLDVVLRPGQSRSHAPAGTVWERQERRRWTLTVHGPWNDAVREIRSRHEVCSVEVRELDLEEIFKDLVRGRGTP